MKKILLGLVLIAFCISLSSCSSKDEKLYLLNWGEYLSDEVVTKFEEQYDCEVVVDPVDSNEAMYTKIGAAGTAYDIAFPSDYMIDRLASEGMLNKVDFTKLTNYEEEAFFEVIDESLEAAAIKDYGVPYFFGSLGIMYNTETLTEEQIMTIKESGWGAIFGAVENAKIGLYDSARDAVSVALMHLGYDVNTTDAIELEQAKDILNSINYHKLGTDSLKADIVKGELDIALVYSGDYFDKYYEAYETDTINFDFYSPETNNLWIDEMVIPTTSKNVDLAHQFIDFILTEEIYLENAESVGYAPVLKNVYQTMKDDPDYDYITSINSFVDQLIDPNFHGQIYKNLTAEHYQRLEDILNEIKSK